MFSCPFLGMFGNKYSEDASDEFREITILRAFIASKDAKWLSEVRGRQRESPVKLRLVCVSFVYNRSF